MIWTLGVGNDTARYLKKLNETVPSVLRKFAMEFYRGITIATPVRTGRARFGWNCSVNSVDYSIPAEGIYALDTERAQNAFAHIKATDTLYVANSVPYIKQLNEGTSRQAPARFVEMRFEETAQRMNQYIRVNGRDN